MQQKTMKFALSIKLQLLFNFIINIMLKLVIYINGLLLAYKQWGNSSVTYAEGWVNFPIKFNKICFTCIPIYTDYGDSPAYTSAVALSKKDVTGFNFRTAANKITLSYIAIGM